MRKGNCQQCGKEAWINAITKRGKGAGEYCADCFEVIFHDEPGEGKAAVRKTPHNDNDPGLDNAVRALEESR